MTVTVHSKCIVVPLQYPSGIHLSEQSDTLVP